MGSAGNTINQGLENITGVKDTEDAERKAKRNIGLVAAPITGVLAGQAVSAGMEAIDAQKVAAEQAAAKQEEIQVKAEEELKKNEEIADKTAEVAKQRTRQKKLAAKKSGRAGTILTNPIGMASTGDAAPLKTLLGS